VGQTGASTNDGIRQDSIQVRWSRTVCRAIADETIPKVVYRKTGEVEAFIESCVEHLKIGICFVRFGKLQMRLEPILRPTKESCAVHLEVWSIQLESSEKLMFKIYFHKRIKSPGTHSKIHVLPILVLLSVTLASS
jgi:hypothetical protein